MKHYQSSVRTNVKVKVFLELFNFQLLDFNSLLVRKQCVNLIYWT